MIKVDTTSEESDAITLEGGRKTLLMVIMSIQNEGDKHGDN